MPNTQLPPVKEKAHEIAKKIANQRPSKPQKEGQEDKVTGGFNQKSRQGADDAASDRDQTSASEGDGQ